MSFMGLKGGDRVEFWAHGGLTMRNGIMARERVKRVGKVQLLLVFPTHVVVNLGGAHGTPATVDADNFIRKVGGRGTARQRPPLTRP